MGEFAPAGSNVRMTQAQVRKYIKDMKNAQDAARERLENARNNGELDDDEKDLEELEKKLDNL